MFPIVGAFLTLVERGRGGKFTPLFIFVITSEQ